MESFIETMHGYRYSLSYDPDQVWAHRARLVAAIKSRVKCGSIEALDMLKDMHHEVMLGIAWSNPDLFTVQNLTLNAEQAARDEEEERLVKIQELLNAARGGDAAAALEFCKTFNPMDWSFHARA